MAMVHVTGQMDVSDAQGGKVGDSERGLSPRHITERLQEHGAEGVQAPH